MADTGKQWLLVTEMKTDQQYQGQNLHVLSVICWCVRGTEYLYESEARLVILYRSHLEVITLSLRIYTPLIIIIIMRREREILQQSLDLYEFPIS